MKLLARMVARPPGSGGRVALGSSGSRWQVPAGTAVVHTQPKDVPAGPGGHDPSKNPSFLRQIDLFRPQFPVDKLKALLDHDNHDTRDNLRTFLSDPVMKPRYRSKGTIRNRRPTLDVSCASGITSHCPRTANWPSRG